MLSKMEFESARLDCAIKQKKGLHFILASILIWTMVFGVQLLDIPIVALIVGLNFEAYVLAIIMIAVEVLFSLCLAAENKSLSKLNAHFTVM